VLSEYPQEYPQNLSAEEVGGWGQLDSAEEGMLDVQLQEAENRSSMVAVMRGPQQL
jgi:hypothetical protein